MEMERELMKNGSLVLLLHAVLLSAGCVGRIAEEARGEYVYGGDVSALTVFEDSGVNYRDGEGVAGDALAILQGAGMNVFRLRLFVEPEVEGIVVNDLEYTLELAKRIEATGAQLLLNLHYSDTWADPAKQYKPKAWKDLPFEELVTQVERYTADVLKAFVAAGLVPEYVQLGNEITNGMLWPDGQVEFVEDGESPSWERFTALQKAAHRGYLTAYADVAARPRKILHIESTGNLPRTEWYLRTAQREGIPFDVAGFSYYPEWHGTLADLQATLNLAARVTEGPVAVVEVAYPWKHDTHWDKIPNLAYPLTPEGQKAFLQAVHQVVQAVPRTRGLGLIWWYPEAVLARDISVWLGGSCGLFDDEGKLLPAASALEF